MTRDRRGEKGSGGFGKGGFLQIRQQEKPVAQAGGGAKGGPFGTEAGKVQGRARRALQEKRVQMGCDGVGHQRVKRRKRATQNDAGGVKQKIFEWAIAASVLPLHGQTTIAAVRNEPLAIGAMRFAWWW